MAKKKSKVKKTTAKKNKPVVKKTTVKKPVVKKKAVIKEKPVAKKKAVGYRPSANVAGGKSYSQVAREVLAKTKGDRKKATVKLKELGCSSAAQVVAKMAIKEGYGTVGKPDKPVAKKSTAKPKVTTKKTTAKKPVVKPKATAKKKTTTKVKPKATVKKKTTKPTEEEFLDEEFEGEFLEEEKEELTDEEEDLTEKTDEELLEGEDF